ncbi:hypothetical protein NE848_05990 [Gramella jeungdoensis]|uniref:Uncharacterized protein n=1 Tax=Gramella jeungdoensis TaxID=708091 RepID=A0ABT0Z2A3_9FLAO|nr:hypothetical protein [Gramella jeungdoensis]MCM8568919.1 hypothetical protein [Gramella jeungdoensis]
MSFGMTAQNLSEDSEKLKADQPEIYESIEKYASSKWWNDPSKKINEINQQAEAFSELCQLVKRGFSRNRYCLEALKQRTEDGKNMSFKEASVNWKEVLLEARQQVEVKTAY